MGRRHDIIILLPIKNINSYKVTLRMSVLPNLRSRNLKNLLDSKSTDQIHLKSQISSKLFTFSNPQSKGS